MPDRGAKIRRGSIAAVSSQALSANQRYSALFDCSSVWRYSCFHSNKSSEPYSVLSTRMGIALPYLLQLPYLTPHPPQERRLEIFVTCIIKSLLPREAHCFLLPGSHCRASKSFLRALPTKGGHQNPLTFEPGEANPHGSATVAESIPTGLQRPPIRNGCDCRTIQPCPPGRQRPSSRPSAGARSHGCRRCNQRSDAGGSKRSRHKTLRYVRQTCIGRFPESTNARDRYEPFPSPLLSRQQPPYAIAAPA